jgi:hypothetical protein
MCALLPLSMPPGLFYGTSSLIREIYQTTNLLSTNPLLALMRLTNISSGNWFHPSNGGLKSRPTGIVLVVLRPYMIAAPQDLKGADAQESRYSTRR